MPEKLQKEKNELISCTNLYCWSIDETILHDLIKRNVMR